MIILKWLFVIWFAVSVTILVYYAAWFIGEWRALK